MAGKPGEKGTTAGRMRESTEHGDDVEVEFPKGKGRARPRSGVAVSEL